MYKGSIFEQFIYLPIGGAPILLSNIRQKSMLFKRLNESVGYQKAETESRKFCSSLKRLESITEERN